MKLLFKTIAAFVCSGLLAASLGGCMSNKEPEKKDPIPVRIAVVGAVMLPGQKMFWITDENPDPPTLSYAVGLSGGPAAGAYIDAVAIHRGGLFGSAKREIVDLRKIMTAPDPKKHDVALKDGDIVEVYTMGQIANMQRR